MTSQWTRLRAWARGVNDGSPWRPPEGLDLAEDPVRATIVEHAKGFVAPFPVRRDGDAVTHEQAFNDLRLWRLPRPHIGALIKRGLLQQCYRASDGAIMLTRESDERELEWRATATPMKVLGRWVSGLGRALAEALPFASH